MKYIRHVLSLICLCCVIGCSHPYSPKPGSYESTLFSDSRRDIFPEDVRKKLESYKDTTLLWTGIVKNSKLSEDSILTDYEHHYWDWIEDYSTQSQVAFLSPRGEGSFQCIQLRKYFGKFEETDLPKSGDMAIVYAKPEGMKPDGTLVLNCAPLIKTLPPKKFATDIWEYGRNYVLKGDHTDFKKLRVP